MLTREDSKLVRAVVEKTTDVHEYHGIPAKFDPHEWVLEAMDAAYRRGRRDGNREGAAAFSGWAIVELMGHRKLAGHVSEVTIAGSAMLRLDVPSDPPVTQFYGGSAIYCITPTTEDLARQVAAASRPTPVSRYQLPPAPPTAEDSIEGADEEPDVDEYDADTGGQHDPDDDPGDGADL